MNRLGLARALAAALALAAPAALVAERPGPRADTRATARASAPAVELVAPAAGARLEAGGRVEVEWRPAAGATPRFEEWEVFLSLDGGATYPFRLTQHLDATRRRARVDLPPFPSDRARFLFRFGDERREAEVELPSLFRLAPARAPLFAPAHRLASGRGEPARSHLPGVAWWVEGPRDGRDARLWLSGELESTWSAGARIAAFGVGLDSAEPDGERPPVALPPAVVELRPAPPANRFALAAFGTPHRSLDRLALQVRRNE